MTEPYFLQVPEVPSSCAVFSSPHSGSEYPQAFLDQTRLKGQAIRSSEDAFVAELFRDAPSYGAPLLAARLPRAYVDLNRGEDELDPALITGVQRQGSNPRIVAGLGVIPRVVAEGRAIRDGKLSLSEAKARLHEGYYPYHAKLSALLDAQRQQHGEAVLFDCHSMPNDALSSAPMVRGKRPNIILGDRFGSSCGRWLMDAASDIFAAHGFVVARNAPFAGGYITQFYGRPSRNVHALQIEIDRSFYMDEQRLTRRADFDHLVQRLSQVIAGLTLIRSTGLPLAAE